MKKILLLLPLAVLNCTAHDWHSHSSSDLVLCTFSRIDKKTSEAEIVTIVRKSYRCEVDTSPEFIYTPIDQKYLHNEKEIQQALREATHVDSY